jgi:putative RNA 2'-phosphotransferase
MRNQADYEAISKAVSHSLRHEPWLYELELDQEGWVPVKALLSGLRGEKPEWSFLRDLDLVEMIKSSTKQRHEIREGKIRALYGHSVRGKLVKRAAEPPGILYHGTSPETAEAIRTEGLRPMARQYVHLSVDKTTAIQVGLRKAKKPVLLQVDAARAYSNGVAFYRGNDVVWLADFIPASFCRIL